MLDQVLGVRPLSLVDFEHWKLEKDTSQDLLSCGTVSSGVLTQIEQPRYFYLDKMINISNTVHLR